MGIGFNLKSILHDRKITIRQLSHMSGVSLNTLYSITKRDSERIDPVVMHKICDALQISDTQLVGLESFNTGEEFENAWNERTSLHGGYSAGFAYGPDGMKVLYSGTARERVTKAFEKLTPEGQEVAAQRVEELTEIPKYRKA